MIQPKLLLVEDSAADVESVMRAVRRLDAAVNVEVAANLAAAMTSLSRRAELPGLVLLDLKLGADSGLDLLRWARGRSDLAHIPFVAFTSSNDPRDVEACYTAGADSFLYKPVSFALFQNSLGSVLDYWRASVDASSVEGKAMRNVVVPPESSSIQT